jgi:hypothetical protein
MTGQGDLFDQRMAVAGRYLGEHLWAELTGDESRAAVAHWDANFVAAEVRREAV